VLEVGSADSAVLSARTEDPARASLLLAAHGPNCAPFRAGPTCENPMCT
jgi:hypothetical protein